MAPETKKMAKTSSSSFRRSGSTAGAESWRGTAGFSEAGASTFTFTMIGVCAIPQPQAQQQAIQTTPVGISVAVTAARPNGVLAGRSVSVAVGRDVAGGEVWVGAGCGVSDGSGGGGGT